MNDPKQSITIVGGGLAGLTLGIGLRQRGVPVVIWEAGHYPRHRVCGEFISGAGLETMQRLGLLDALAETPTRLAQTAIFFSGNQPSRLRALPRAALCVSRRDLDARLAEHFRELGGELRCGMRWKAGLAGEKVVHATGRCVQKDQGGWRWYGLKAHARHLELAADLEMHFTKRGYVGLCRLPDGLVNVCGLFRRCRTDPALPKDVVARFCDESDGALAERLRRGVWDSDSWCAVAGLSYRAHPPDTGIDCAIGDALAVIPPVTGNGMSMAFESAELALQPLAEFGAGRAEWRDVCQRVRSNCCHAFGRRLRGARGLHRAIFSGPIRKALLPLVSRSELLWKIFFQITR